MNEMMPAAYAVAAAGSRASSIGEKPLRTRAAMLRIP
jgi:hypothetical protein